MVLEPGEMKKLVCTYHGRRFDNEGNFEYMPEFRDAKNFPRPCDNLHNFPLSFLLKLLNILAKIRAPVAVSNQPTILILPNFAKLAGRTKIPAPIIFPTTKDVAANRRIF